MLARIPSDITVAQVYDRLVSLRLSQFDYYLSTVPGQQQHYIAVERRTRQRGSLQEGLLVYPSTKS